MFGDFNIYYVLFGILVAIDFILFNLGMLILFLAKEDIIKRERGRKFLFNSFILFAIILLITAGFYFFNLFFGEKTPGLPPGTLEKLPPAYHISSFPPGPEFIKLGQYYFSGPKLLKDNSYAGDAVIYAVLCKKNEKYDTIYISQAGEENLLGHNQEQCWLKSCENNINNLYLATLLSKEKEIIDNLNYQLNPSCLEHE